MRHQLQTLVSIKFDMEIVTMFDIVFHYFSSIERSYMIFKGLQIGLHAQFQNEKVLALHNILLRAIILNSL